jgi:hypothetical protein
MILVSSSPGDDKKWLNNGGKDVFTPQTTFTFTTATQQILFFST